MVGPLFSLASVLGSVIMVAANFVMGRRTRVKANPIIPVIGGVSGTLMGSVFMIIFGILFLSSGLL